MKHRTLLFATALAAWTLAVLSGGYAASPPNQQQLSVPADLSRQEKELRDALSANPNDAAAHLRLARVYIEQGRFSAAIDQAHAARQGKTQNDEADAVLAWALYLAGDQRLLFVEIKPGQREPHAESLVRLSLGLANMNPLEIDKAGPLLQDAVQLDPNSYRARLAFSRFLTLKGEFSGAREQIDEARKLAPGELGVMRIAAELDRAQGNADAAIAGFTKGLELEPNSMPTLAGRADALIHQDKLAEAEQDVVKALRQGPSSQLMFLEGLILARQGKMKEADQILAKASSSFWHEPIGYYLQAAVKLRLGEPETAYYLLAKFNGTQPDVTAAASLLAEMALHRKDPAAAIRLLRPIVDANPADQESVTRLARAYLFNGQPDRVIELYRQVIAAPVLPMEPKVDRGSLMMVYGDAVDDLTEIEMVFMGKTPEAVMPMISLRQGDIDKAAALAEPLAQANPDDPVAQNLLGSVRLAQRRLPDAETIFRGIVEKHPDFIPAAFNLVEVLVASNKLDEVQPMLADLAQHAADG